MSTTVWYFIETSTGGMKRFPVAGMRRFLDGEETVDRGISGLVRVVEVILTVERRQVVSVQRVICPQYRITPDGLLDGEHWEDAGALAMRVIDIDALSLPENVVGFDKHLARRDTEQHHRWVPSEAQLQQVANAINQAAVVPPVVAVAGSEIVPV